MRSDRRSCRLACAALVIVVGLLVVVGPAARPAAAAAVPSADAGFLSLLNGLRSSLGLGTLAADPQLSGVARSWSATMASSGTLAHNDALSSQVDQAWTRLGENVGTGSSASQIFDALVASPAHLRNMADPAFSLVGIGSVTNASGALWTTHVFLQPPAARAARTPAPPKPATVAAPTTTRAPKPAPSTAATAGPVAPPPPTVAPVTTAAPAPPATMPPDPITAASDGSSTGPAAPASSPAPEAAPLRLASRQERSLAGPVAAGALLVVLVLLAVSGSAGLLLPRRPPGSGRVRGAR